VRSFGRLLRRLNGIKNLPINKPDLNLK